MLEPPSLPDGENETTHLSVALEKSNISKPRKKRPPSFVATRDDEIKSTTFDNVESVTSTTEKTSEAVTSAKPSHGCALPGMAGMNAFKLPELGSVKLKSTGTKTAVDNERKEPENAEPSMQQVMLKPSGRKLDPSATGKQCLPVMPQGVDFRANLKKSKPTTESPKTAPTVEDTAESEKCSVSQNRFKFANIPVQQNATPSMAQLKAAAAERKLKEAKAAEEAKALQADSSKTSESEENSVPMDIEPNPSPVSSSDNMEMDTTRTEMAKKTESTEDQVAQLARSRRSIPSISQFTDEPVLSDTEITEKVSQPTKPNSICVSPSVKFEESKRIFTKRCYFETPIQHHSIKPRTKSLILIDESKFVKNRIKFFVDRQFASDGASSTTNSVANNKRKSFQ